MALVDLLQFPHFIVMLAGFLHLSIAITIVALHKPKNWRTLHFIFAATGIELIIIALLILSGLILDIPHGIIGLITAIILIIDLISGYIAIKKKDQKIRLGHIWIGRIIYIITFVVIILGIMNFV